MNPVRAARLVAAFTALGALACGGSPVRGGYTARDTLPVQVKTLAVFVPGHCEDTSHADRAPRVAAVELVETPNGRTLLFEHRQGHAVLVAENHFDDGPLWVFQVVIKAQNLVREWRIPRSAGATGMLLVGRELTEATHAERFEAKLASTNLSCSLVPESSVLPNGSTNPVP